MRRIAKVLAIALLLTTVWSSTAHAAPAWFTARPCLAGIVPTSIGPVFVVRLTDAAASPAFECALFVNITIAKEMLATTLTAMAADLPVLVFVDPSVIPSEISRLLLKQ